MDEIHYAKQRAVENISQRRQLVTALTTQTAQRNPDLHVLGMSATPVINNLQEGRSMVEVISGLAHDELAWIAHKSQCPSRKSLVAADLQPRGAHSAVGVAGPQVVMPA